MVSPTLELTWKKHSEREVSTSVLQQCSSSRSSSRSSSFSSSNNSHNKSDIPADIRPAALARLPASDWATVEEEGHLGFIQYSSSPHGSETVLESPATGC